jgi:hypothetical protein
MASFLIEVPHGEDKLACVKAIKIFVDTGSHFLANADWGCSDSEHKAWMIVDVDTKEQALQIVPPMYRRDAKIIKLFKLTKKEVDYFNRKNKLNETGKYHQ